MTTQIIPSRDRMMELREKEEMGFYTAQMVALREAMLEAIDGAQDINDLKPVLRTLVNKWAMKT